MNRGPLPQRPRAGRESRCLDADGVLLRRDVEAGRLQRQRAYLLGVAAASAEADAFS